MIRLLLESKTWISAQLKKIVSDERGEVNVVAIVVLIGVAIALAIVFKEGISELLTSMIGGLQDKADTAME